MSRGSRCIVQNSSLDSSFLPVKWDTWAGSAFSKEWYVDKKDGFMWITDEYITFNDYVYIFMVIFYL